MYVHQYRNLTFSKCVLGLDYMFWLGDEPRNSYQAEPIYKLLPLGLFEKKNIDIDQSNLNIELSFQVWACRWDVGLKSPPPPFITKMNKWELKAFCRPQLFSFKVVCFSGSSWARRCLTHAPCTPRGCRTRRRSTASSSWVELKIFNSNLGS